MADEARQTAEPATPEEVKELARQDYHLIGWCCLEILTDMEAGRSGWPMSLLALFAFASHRVASTNPAIRRGAVHRQRPW